MVTNDAMTTMKDGIRTLEGMMFLSDDTTMLEQTNTKVVARPIPMPFIAEVVTARAGHIPSTSTKIGCSFHNPRVKSDHVTISIPYSISPDESSGTSPDTSSGACSSCSARERITSRWAAKTSRPVYTASTTARGEMVAPVI